MQGRDCVEDDDGTGADNQANILSSAVVLSGRSCPARLVGTGHSHGLSLLQIAGGPAFRPVAVGNSRYLGRGAAVTAVGSAGLAKTFTLDIGNLTSGTGRGSHRHGSRRGQADPGGAFAMSQTGTAVVNVQSQDTTASRSLARVAPADRPPVARQAAGQTPGKPASGTTPACRHQVGRRRR